MLFRKIATHRFMIKTAGKITSIISKFYTQLGGWFSLLRMTLWLSQTFPNDLRFSLTIDWLTDWSIDVILEIPVSNGATITSFSWHKDSPTTKVFVQLVQLSLCPSTIICSTKLKYSFARTFLILLFNRISGILWACQRFPCFRKLSRRPVTAYNCNASLRLHVNNEDQHPLKSSFGGFYPQLSDLSRFQFKQNTETRKI